MQDTDTTVQPQEATEAAAQEAANISPSEAFIALAKEKETLVEALKIVNEGLEKIMGMLGEGKMVQDPETKVVYQVVKPKGTFVAFKEIDYVRTRRTLEERGDLSMEKAIEAGFDLGELGPKKKAKKD
jgi:hypothetical protein